MFVALGSQLFQMERSQAVGSLSDKVGTPFDGFFDEINCEGGVGVI